MARFVKSGRITHNFHPQSLEGCLQLSHRLVICKYSLQREHTHNQCNFKNAKWNKATELANDLLLYIVYFNDLPLQQVFFHITMMVIIMTHNESQEIMRQRVHNEGH